jgi:DNA-binding GntR family transcriptional regulator
VPDWDPSQYLYVQLADDIAAKIADGSFPAGSLLPGEAELAELYEIPRLTVRRALDELKDRGLVQTRGRDAVVTAAG